MKIYLALASLANIGLAVVGLLPAMMSAMLFDAPGSEDNPVLWAVVAAIWMFSVVAFASAIAPWPLLRRQRSIAAIISTLGAAALFVFIVTVPGGGLIFVMRRQEEWNGDGRSSFRGVRLTDLGDEEGF